MTKQILKWNNLKIVNLFIHQFNQSINHLIGWNKLIHFQNADDMPFIEKLLVDSHTLEGDVYGSMSRWIRDTKKKQNDKFEFPKYDFLALFTRLLQWLLMLTVIE